MGEHVSGFGVPGVDGADPLLHLYGACRVLRRHGINTSAMEAYGQHPYLVSPVVGMAADVVCRAELLLVTGVFGVEDAQTYVNEAAGLALHTILFFSVQEGAGPARVG